MKTILYIDHTAKIGGGEIALLNLIAALDMTCYRPVVLLASDGPLVGRMQDAGIETHVLPLDPAIIETRKDTLGIGSLLHIRRAWSLLRYAVRVARFAKERGADLLHTNSLKADIYGGIAGRLAGIPVLWHVRDNIDSQYLPGRAAAAFRLLARLVPQVVVANSESTLRRLKPPRRKFSAVVYSGYVEDFLNRQRVVHDGYNVGEFQELLHKPGTRSGPVVALVGRIAGWKGQHIFLQAAADVLRDCPAARFLVIGAPLFGEQDYEQSLHQMARDLGIAEQVEFLGFRDDVPALLSQVDLLVHASTLGEPFGQVVIEGMAAGKPVIATDGGALPEIVVPGETGLLVPMGDAPAMAAAIRQILADPARAHAMGAAGRQRVRERFTIDHTAQQVQTVYQTIFSENPGAAGRTSGLAFGGGLGRD